MTNLWLLESPDNIIEGETITYSIEWLGASAVSGTTCKVYFNNADVTSTVMPSGSFSQSGTVSTLKPLAAQTGHGGGIYVVVPQATVDGNTELRKFELRVLSAKAEQ
jgi:hypothetical protein